MKTVKRIARVVFPVLSVLMIAFIFWQSSLDADVSSEESGSLLETLNRFLSSLGISPFLSDHLIRKAAHFSEYFILGTLLFCTMKVWLDRDVLVLIYPAGAGLLTASCDEFIQLFSNGRSGELKDVLLDLAGVLTAVVVLYFLLWLLRDIRKSRAKDGGSDEETDDAPQEKAFDTADGDTDEETPDEAEGSVDENRKAAEAPLSDAPDSPTDHDTDSDTDNTEKRETEIE